jgi:AraC-like DNA-binding protein
MKKILIWEEPCPLKLIAFKRQPARATLSSPIRFNLHRHTFYELGMVLAGKCEWTIRRRRLGLHAGQAVLVKAGSLHGEEIPGEQTSELAWVGFDFAGPAPDWSEKVVPLGGDLDEIAASFHAIYREHSSADSLTNLRVALALQNILVLVSRRAENDGAGKKKPRHSPGKSRLNARQVRSLESAAHYFRHNFQASLSVAQIAAYHSFCPAYFSTIFRRHFGVPPRAFLRQVKLEKATELLLGSDLTMKEISGRCGFVDAAHFTKAFKQKHRLTPGAYRLKPPLSFK